MEEAKLYNILLVSLRLMQTWQKRLESAFLTSHKSVILGVGNDLKADDGVGPFIVEQLQTVVPSQVELINASTVPENFINHLIEEKPSFILIIDAALMGAEPGEIRLIDKNTIDGVAFSTHQLPLTFFLEYLEHHLATTILILGIQPVTDEFTQPISEPVQIAAQHIIITLTKIFQKPD